MAGLRSTKSHNDVSDIVGIENIPSVEIFFTICDAPPGNEPWSINADQSLVGLSLSDVAEASIISDNVLKKGEKSSITIKINQEAWYSMAICTNKT